MRIKIYGLIIILSIFVTGFSIYFGTKSINGIITQKSKEIYLDREKEFQVYYDDKKIFLNSFAKFLSSSNIVIQAYLHNDRKSLINYIKPLYDNLHSSHIIEEIHFFKRPAISFVNFSNLTKYNFSVAKARADILWINSSFQPSNHFYVCRLYPGLRATYPIIYNDKLLGSVSFGIGMKQFKNLFEKLGATNVSLYLKDSVLKNMLLPIKYKYYSKLPLYKGYRVSGKVLKVNLKNGYKVKNDNVYTKIQIKDFFGHIIGYIVIEDNMSKSINILKNSLKEKMFVEIFGFIIIFLIIFILFKWIFDKMKKINNILFLIKNQRFSKIPHKIEEKDELDVYKNNLIDVAKKIQTYIKLLTQQVEEYSDKAFKDGLTNIFNRRFLEEKSCELFINFNLTHEQIGIVMMDIDDFKKINDTYGHDIGDLVLIKLADTITHTIRKEDLFIRYGGEEFLLILAHSNIDNTYKIAEKVRQAIENIIIDISHKSIKFSISLGVSEVLESDEDIYETIKRADNNLYKAKRNGKNRVEI